MVVKGEFWKTKKKGDWEVRVLFEVSFFFLKRKIGRVGGTCSRKSQTLF